MYFNNGWHRLTVISEKALVEKAIHMVGVSKKAEYPPVHDCPPELLF
jgi:hypothetical protein